MENDRDQPNFFAGPYIDRRAEMRDSAHWREEALADPNTLCVVSRGTTHLLYAESEPRIAFLNVTNPLAQEAAEQQLTLLGWYHGARCLLLELPADIDTSRLPAGASFQELRPLSNTLAPDDAALLAYTRALIIWRSRYKFCGVCGSPTRSVRAGHALRCTNETCSHEIYPRLDPAIIVLVSDGERALLGRQASWPTGRYSTLAGFVEPGESLEDAVKREVMEETGVRVHAIQYHSSQPWPFPSSLMIGFQARGEPGDIIKLDGELEDARWFTREEVTSGTAVLPPVHSISYRLIATWLGIRPRSSTPR